MILRCFPRLHLGLMDMGNATPRRYGGAGFTVSAPFTEISANPATKIIIKGLEKIDHTGAREVLNSVSRLVDAISVPGVRLRLRQVPPQHIGLGTKTSLLLGALTSAALAYGITPSKKLLQTISGRGGASGVGVNSFFTGGFITDAGHSGLQNFPFAPSSLRSPSAVAPVICRSRIPKDWMFFLILPRGRRFFARQEVSFFSSNTPIGEVEVLRSISILYHGIVPSVLTSDLQQLAESLSELHKVGFKKRELQGQPKSVRTVLTTLSKIHGCAAGLSSIGPLVYAITHAEDMDVRTLVEKQCDELGAKLITTCSGRNRGFEVLT